MTWEAVEAVVGQANSIAWDGCHKIYVLMDDEQTEQMRSWDYGDDDDSYLLSVDDTALATLREWWNASCGLRFIQAVRTVKGDPNKGYINLIAQGEMP